MSTTEEPISVSLAWAKMLGGVGALIFSVSFALSAQEWWQFVTAGTLVLLGIVLLFSASRDLLSRRRDRRVAQDDVG
ncbi:hypothetical protein [Microbacterium sp. PMB16]|uniref:hypothetical protein n=1 Tax=Microbacterium sp. PMB16 TaxID=3120157 RepID=UPI003F4C3601